MTRPRIEEAQGFVRDIAGGLSNVVVPHRIRIEVSKEAAIGLSGLLAIGLGGCADQQVAASEAVDPTEAPATSSAVAVLKPSATSAAKLPTVVEISPTGRVIVQSSSTPEASKPVSTVIATQTSKPEATTIPVTTQPATQEPTKAAPKLTETPVTKLIPGVSIKAELLDGIDAAKTTFIEKKNLNDPEEHPLIVVVNNDTKKVSHVVRYNEETQGYEWSKGLKPKDSADILGITVSAKLANPYNRVARARVDQFIKEQLNGGVPLYTSWHQTEAEKGKFTFENADDVVNKAIADGLRIRGDHLVYPYSNFQYTFLKDMKGASRDDLLNAMKAHITEVMTHFKGRIKTWGVVNEARPPSELNPKKDGKYDYMWDRIGPDYVDIAFATARKADPTAKLIYNETRSEVVSGRLYNSTKAIVDRLKTAGTIDGVGIQMHLDGANLPNPSDVAAAIKSFGIDVHITEFSIDMSKLSGTDEEKSKVEADYYRKIFKALLATGVVKEINFWDDIPLMGGLTFKPDARFDAFNEALAEQAGIPKP